MSNELKPCPFCGQPMRWAPTGDMGTRISHVHRYKSSSGDYTPVTKSMNCGDPMPHVRAEFWNSRPIEDALRAHIEKLEKR